ncbi:tRNA methyl transferase PRC-barrel domain-containing protein [Chryseobacterium sp. T1]
MINKGQIVEIPASSLLYKKEAPVFLSKKEELSWKSLPKNYSLFDGFLVGGHSGYENFKIGQRKGINVGGKKAPLYVIEIDKSDNRIFVGAGELHPGLWTSVLRFSITSIDWLDDFNPNNPELELGVSVEISTLILEKENHARLFVFDEDVFLEFEKPISVTIENYPIDILVQKKIIANIKTI